MAQHQGAAHAGRAHAEAPQRRDRRVEKTKAALRVALLELLEEKELDHITVKELAERADVTRRTFYLHYGTIEDFLDEIAAEDLPLLFDGMRLRYLKGDAFDFLCFFEDVVALLDEREGYYNTLLTDRACRALMSEAIERYVQASTAEEGRVLSPVTRAYLVFVAMGAGAILYEWLVGTRETPLEEVAAVATHMAQAAIEGVRAEMGRLTEE